MLLKLLKLDLKPESALQPLLNKKKNFNGQREYNFGVLNLDFKS